jgi:hypothetical protein
MSKAKKVIWVLLIAALVFIAFIIGGIVGFNDGYAYHSFIASTSDAYLTLSTIESIDSNETVAAKAKLEQQLDARLIEHWAGLVHKPLSFNLLPQNEEAVKKLMGKVAKYRKAHPQKIENPQVKSAIEAVITRYVE